ncbi:MAG: hypothetical protein LBD69_00470 [Puniceicoccales bacterium]|jgi:hypothetical protein|nr:hypothetical protein [Puniceicoccales bacterium]
MLKSLLGVMLGGCLGSSLYGANVDFSRQIQWKYWVPPKKFSGYSKSIRMAADHLKNLPSRRLLNRFQGRRSFKKDNTYTLFQIADKKMRVIIPQKNETPRSTYNIFKK